VLFVNVKNMADNNIIVIETEKGKPAVAYGEFIYRFDKRLYYTILYYTIIIIILGLTRVVSSYD
jgi:hypothetical protein